MNQFRGNLRASGHVPALLRWREGNRPSLAHGIVDDSTRTGDVAAVAGVLDILRRVAPVSASIAITPGRSDHKAASSIVAGLYLA